MWPFTNNKYKKQHKRIAENIKNYGWQFQFVFDKEGKKVDFAYSIGFERSFDHPEIMIFGLKRETMHSLLSSIAGELKNGKEYKPNTKVTGVLSGNYEVMFKPLDEKWHNELAGIAARYYAKSFRIYVMLWPDKNNTLPIENGCTLTLQNEVLEYV
ncbi:DUF4262 domain-containing protein [Gayadomonas joobiniege]|uniref:DUF4262 domain-containing protein n=1 Tax=Gayadomonas joobiniege TaxID=1234606 RepID=UPI00035E5046|nr:DUF4262 domain-containing protein [Gayadomonas joobiniege]